MDRYCPTIKRSGSQKLCQHSLNSWTFTWWPSWRVSRRNNWLEMVNTPSQSLSIKWVNVNVCRSLLGQVPIATGCCVLIARGLQTFLPILQEEDGRQLEESETELKPDVLAFDYPGATTLAIWISSLLIVIDLQNQLSWGHPLVLGITIVGALAILVFLALETYPGNRELLIPLRLLRTEVGAFCAGQVSRVLRTIFPHVICFSSHHSRDCLL